MTKTVIVAFNSNTETSGTQTFALQPRFNLDVDGQVIDVIVHFDPREGNSFTDTVPCNYDVLIDNHLFCEAKKNRTIDYRCGKPIVTLLRRSKSDNMFHAVKYGRKHGIEVLCPYTVIKKGKALSLYPQLPASVDGLGDKLIFKPEHGANGDFQFMINRDKYFVTMRALLDCKTTWNIMREGNLSTFVTLFLNDTYNESYGEREVLNLNPMAVFPFVEDVITEYRVLRGGDFIRVSERKLGVSEGTSRVEPARHAFDIGNKVNDYDKGKASLEKYISLDTVKSFLDDIGHFYGSLDIYVRNTPKGPIVGIFEYSTQHGVTYVTADDHIAMAHGYLAHVLSSTGIVKGN